MEAKKIWEDAQRAENERRSETANSISDMKALAAELFQPIHAALTDLLPEIRKIKRATLSFALNGADFKWNDSLSKGWIRIIAVGIRSPGHENGGYSVSVESTDSAHYPRESHKAYDKNEVESAIKHFLTEVSKLK